MKNKWHQSIFVKSLVLSIVISVTISGLLMIVDLLRGDKSSTYFFYLFTSIILFIFALPFVIGIQVSTTRAKRRTQALQNIASKLKLSFANESELWKSYSYHSIFDKFYDDCEASNIIYGSYNGKTLHYFDYFGTSGRYSCVLCDFDDKTHMKILYIRPKGLSYKLDESQRGTANKGLSGKLDEFQGARKGLFDKSIGTVGFEHIDFGSSEFSKKFLVESEDKKFAYDVIHTRMMEFFLQNKIYYSFELCEHSILLYGYGFGRRKPQDVEHMLDTMVNFVNLLPDYLLKELRENRDNGDHF